MEKSSNNDNEEIRLLNDYRTSQYCPISDKNCQQRCVCFESARFVSYSEKREYVRRPVCNHELMKRVPTKDYKQGTVKDALSKM